MSVVSFVGVLSLVFLRMPSIGFVTTYVCLAFAGGVLCTDALLHLLPHALEGADHSTMGAVGLAASAGCLSLIVLAEVCEWHQHAHGHDIKAYGVANLVVEMLHNFVDGLTLGLAFLAGTTPGFGATFAVALHELPQELGDFMVLREAGFPLGRLLAWNFAASLTCVAGVAVAHFVGEESTIRVQRYLMAFTAGSFLTLSLNMIIPQVLAVIHSRHEPKSMAAVRAKLLCLAVMCLAAYSLLRLGDLEGHDHGHDHGHEHGAGHAHGGGHAHGEL